LETHRVVTDYGTALVTAVPDQGLAYPDCVRIERQYDRLVSFTKATCTVTTEKGRPIPCDLRFEEGWWLVNGRKFDSGPAAINVIMHMNAVLESASWWTGQVPESFWDRPDRETPVGASRTPRTRSASPGRAQLRDS
jgi:hypothetical protein